MHLLATGSLALTYWYRLHGHFHRMRDVGRPKATVAAERINERIVGAKVVAHHSRIEDMSAEW